MHTQPDQFGPLECVYVAPDVAPNADELAWPPRVVVGPDGALLLHTLGAAGEPHAGERVIRIDRFPPFALVQVLDDGAADEPCEPPARISYLVRESALPPAADHWHTYCTHRSAKRGAHD